MSHIEVVRRVVRAYDDRLVRAYCWCRFIIMRQCFLEQIGASLPASGAVLDVGCGFGLFSLYYAQIFPGLRLLGIDKDPRRIALARRAAHTLGVTNVTYEQGDAASLHVPPGQQAAYMLDIIHHIPPEAVGPLLAQFHRSLVRGGVLIVKDIDTRPAPKRWFTHLLDRLMDPRTPVNYWPAAVLCRELEEAGFTVQLSRLKDYLPYPHVLYVCQKA